VVVSKLGPTTATPGAYDSDTRGRQSPSHRPSPILITTSNLTPTTIETVHSNLVNRADAGPKVLEFRQRAGTLDLIEIAHTQQFYTAPHSAPPSEWLHRLHVRG
jgi:hypothetical protein